MAATNYTPIQLYYSTTASAVPLAANLAQGELAINIADGKLYYEDSTGVVQVIATKGAGTIGGSTTQIQYNNAGALAGSSAMTFNNSTNVVTLTTLNLTNALGATYGGTAQSSYTQGDLLYSSATNTLSKLGIGTVDYILTSTGSVPQWSAPSSISVLTATNLAGGAAGSVPYQSAASTTTFLAIGTANRVMTSTGTAPQWVTSLTGLTGVSSSSITNTSLTSGRVVYSGASGVQTDDADLTFDGTTLSAGGYSTAGLTTLVKTVKIGDSNFSGVAVFAAATPAKLYIGTGTVTDTTSAIGATNAVGAISSLAITPIAATNTSVTYTNAATLYIAGAPSAGTNVTLTNPYSLYIAAGASYFGGDVTFANQPIYSGGTANGVMYLNASKQITTGTALSFDASTLLINTANTSYRGQLSLQGGASDFAQITFYRGATADTNQVGYVHSLNTAGSNQAMVIGARNGAFLKFDVGDSQRAAIDTSGRLLVGVTSGNYALDVGDVSGGNMFRFTRSGTELSAFISAGTPFFGTTSNTVLAIMTNSTERGRFDTSGNLLVNTTNNYAVGATGYVMAKTGFVFANDNTSSASNRNWLINSNGSAAGSLDFVDSATNTGWPNNAYRMSLTSAGQLLLGVTSIASGFSGLAQLQVSGTNGGIVINSSNTGGSDYSRLVFTKLNSSGNEGLIRYNTNDYHMAFFTSASEAGRFTGAGNFGVGTTGPLYKIQAYNGTSRTLIYAQSDLNFSGAYLGTATSTNRGASLELVSHSDGVNAQAWRTAVSLDLFGAQDLVWSNAPNSTTYAGLTYTNRMRLDTAGNLLLGTTTAGGRLTVATTTAVDATLTVKAELANYASIINIEAQNDNGAIYNYIASNTTSVTQHWKISGGAATNTMAFSTGGTERARFNSTGAFVFAGGTTTANGIGITFPATQSASSNANTLDDYEEGTFTPFVTADTGPSSITYYGRGGQYTRVGNVVYFNLWIAFGTTFSGASGGLYVGGLPYTSTSGSVNAPTISAWISSTNYGAGYTVTPIVIYSSTTIWMTRSATGASYSFIPASAIVTGSPGSEWRLTGYYFVD